MTGALRILAGPAALSRIKRDGFELDTVKVFAGASGGAKWLVLYGLDLFLAEHFFPRRVSPLHFLGSSIGSWRAAAHAQADPVQAIKRLAENYIHYIYRKGDGPAEMSPRSRAMLRASLGDNGGSQALSHPTHRLHLLAGRSRGVMASERRWLLGSLLVLAAGLNALSRTSLGWFFDRVVFSDPRDPPPFDHLDGFGTSFTPLSTENFFDALMGSGSIPLITHGVQDIPGAPAGSYRDGGIIDYHLDLDFGVEEGFVLMPHFYSTITPGWFDKTLGNRRARLERFDNVVLLAPSSKFVASLPHGKIPDRRDFGNFTDDERTRAWRTCMRQSECLAEEFEQSLSHAGLADKVEPFTI